MLSIVDWQYFVKAMEAILHGNSPYTVPGVYSPPWVFWLLLPLFWLPTLAGMSLPVWALLYAAIRRKKPLLILVVAFASPFWDLITGNIDWIALTGLLSVSYLSPLLLASKPQASGLVLVAYLHKKRWRFLVPLVIAFLAGFIMWGWPLSVSFGGLLTAHHNVSLFPYSIPVGAYAIYRTWREYDPDDPGDLGSAGMWGCIASLSMSPYLAGYSYVPAIFAVSDRNMKVGALLSAASWLRYFV